MLMALHGMAHGFIELDKVVVHVKSFDEFYQLAFFLENIFYFEIILYLQKNKDSR